MPVRQSAPEGLERSQTETSNRRPSENDIYGLRGEVDAAVQFISPPNHFHIPAMMGVRVSYKIYLFTL